MKTILSTLLLILLLSHCSMMIEKNSCDSFDEGSEERIECMKNEGHCKYCRSNRDV